LVTSGAFVKNFKKNFAKGVTNCPAQTLYKQNDKKELISMKIEHAVMRLKWMIFGVALLLGCVLFNQITNQIWLSLPVALVGFIIVLCNLILLGVETPKEKKEPAEEDKEEPKETRKISQIDPFFRHYEK
jgi:hypothetical protein